MARDGELRLRFGDGGICVRADSEQLLKPLKNYLHEHLVPEYECPATLQLHLRKTISPIPTHAALVLRYYGLKGFFEAGRTYFTDFRSYLTIQPDGKKALGFISPETLKESGLHFFTHIFFTIALFEMLRHQRIFFLHSAALVSPGGQSLIFPASAGQGKSTLTLYLIREGFGYLSDDTIFLSRAGGRVCMTGFQKLSHLPEEIFDSFTELKSFKNAPRLESRGKKMVSLEKVFPGRRIHENLSTGALFFLQKTKNRPSRLEPLDKIHAFQLLLDQSPFASINPGLAQEHMNILRDCVAANRTWLFKSGSDWLRNPRLLKTILAAALNGGGL
jgi:hypothetical protein